uniref:Rho-GAP domain-containing protein n=2 Tax=Neoptera TaxID=33340 RepID=A0A7R8ZAN1_TIMDO|nr:unnamed protein product [Timema douglasi]
MKKQFFRVKQLADQTFSRAGKTEVLSDDLQEADRKVEYIRTACQNTSKKLASSLIGQGLGHDAAAKEKKLPVARSLPSLHASKFHSTYFHFLIPSMQPGLLFPHTVKSPRLLSSLFLYIAKSSSGSVASVREGYHLRTYRRQPHYSGVGHDMRLKKIPEYVLGLAMQDAGTTDEDCLLRQRAKSERNGGKAESQVRKKWGRVKSIVRKKWGRVKSLVGKKWGERQRAKSERNGGKAESQVRKKWGRVKSIVGKKWGERQRAKSERNGGKAESQVRKKWGRVKSLVGKKWGERQRAKSERNGGKAESQVRKKWGRVKSIVGKKWGERQRAKSERNGGKAESQVRKKWGRVKSLVGKKWGERQRAKSERNGGKAESQVRKKWGRVKSIVGKKWGERQRAKSERNGGKAESQVRKKWGRVKSLVGKKWGERQRAKSERNGGKAESQVRKKWGRVKSIVGKKWGERQRAKSERNGGKAESQVRKKWGRVKSLVGKKWGERQRAKSERNGGKAESQVRKKWGRVKSIVGKKWGERQRAKSERNGGKAESQVRKKWGRVKSLVGKKWGERQRAKSERNGGKAESQVRKKWGRVKSIVGKKWGERQRAKSERNGGKAESQVRKKWGRVKSLVGKKWGERQRAKSERNGGKAESQVRKKWGRVKSIVGKKWGERQRAKSERNGGKAESQVRKKWGRVKSLVGKKWGKGRVPIQKEMGVEHLTAVKHSGGASTGTSRAESIKEELEDAELKVEQCRDHLASEMFQLLSREADLANVVVQYVKLQRVYHESALKLLEKVIPDLETSIDESSSKPVYGYPLEDHLRITGRKIAFPIELCVCALLELGMEEEGLFRVAGGSSKLRRIKMSFDACCLTLPTALEYRDPHVIAGALKSYLRDLPEPLMTHGLYDEWMAAARVQTSNDARLQALWQVVHKLPQANYDNLRYLVKFLAALSRNQEVNKMTPQNIAIVIAPNLIWSREDEGNMGCSRGANLAEKYVSKITIKTKHIAEDRRKEEDVTFVHWILPTSPLFSFPGMNMNSANMYSFIVDNLVTFSDWFFPGELDFYQTLCRESGMVNGLMAASFSSLSGQLSSEAGGGSSPVDKGLRHARSSSGEGALIATGGDMKRTQSNSSLSDHSSPPQGSPKPATRRKNKPAPVPPANSATARDPPSLFTPPDKNVEKPDKTVEKPERPADKPDKPPRPAGAPPITSSTLPRPSKKVSDASLHDVRTVAPSHVVESVPQATAEKQQKSYGGTPIGFEPFVAPKKTSDGSDHYHNHHHPQQQLVTISSSHQKLPEKVSIGSVVRSVEETATTSTPSVVEHPHPPPPHVTSAAAKSLGADHLNKSFGYSSSTLDRKHTGGHRPIPVAAPRSVVNVSAPTCGGSGGKDPQEQMSDDGGKLEGEAPKEEDTAGSTEEVVTLRRPHHHSEGGERLNKPAIPERPATLLRPHNSFRGSRHSGDSLNSDGGDRNSSDVSIVVIRKKPPSVHPTEIRTSISPSSAVELQHDKRVSQLHATEAGLTELDIG